MVAATASSLACLRSASSFFFWSVVGVDRGSSSSGDTTDSGHQRQTETPLPSEAPEGGAAAADTAQEPTGNNPAALASSPTSDAAAADGAIPDHGGGGGGGRKLASERPAVVEEVLDDDVVADFNYLGSSEPFALVGCVVASVSRDPFEATEVSPRVRKGVTGRLRVDGSGRVGVRVGVRVWVSVWVRPMNSGKYESLGKCKSRIRVRGRVRVDGSGRVWVSVSVRPINSGRHESLGKCESRIRV